MLNRERLAALLVYATAFVVLHWWLRGASVLRDRMDLLYWLVAAALLFAIVAAPLVAVRRLHVFVASSALTLVAIELGLRAFPQAIPRSTLQALPVSIVNRAYGISTEQVVLYLDAPPYVQLKPNVVARIMNFRDEDVGWVSTWKTDEIGFKNRPGLYRNTPRFDIVTVGDSFTEGMGVALEQAWPSLLNDRGISTLNLGVEGYKHQQSKAVYEKYAADKPHTLALWGYTSGTHGRAQAFERQVASGQPITRTAAVQADTFDDRYLIVWQLLRTGGRSLGRQWLQRSPRGSDNVFSEYAAIYKDHVSDTGRQQPELDAGRDEAWQVHLNVLRQANDAARRNGSRMVLLYFPLREAAYAGRARQCGVQASLRRFFEDERAAMRAFAEAEQIAFIDFFDTFNRYVLSLPCDAPYTRLPYFRYDGHLSPVGNRLIAVSLCDALARRPDWLGKQCRPS